MKTNILPPDDFIETFISKVENMVGDNLKVEAELASVEHPIETLINAQLFITEILHQGYPDYWDKDEHDKLRQLGGRPTFKYSEWIAEFKDLNLKERLRDELTEQIDLGDGDYDVTQDHDSSLWRVSDWLDSEYFMSFDHFNDRNVACVALAQVWVIVIWLKRFAPNHSRALEIFSFNIYHKLGFWISPWYSDHWSENWYVSNSDKSLDERDHILSQMSKQEQYRFVSTLECIKRLGFGFDALETGTLERKVSSQVFEEARKKFEKRKPAHVDDKLLNEVTDILEGINDGVGVGVGCVATFMSGKPKRERERSYVGRVRCEKTGDLLKEGTLIIKYENAKTEVAYKAIVRELNEKLVPYGFTYRSKKKGTEKDLFQCHPKVQEFIKLWPAETLSEHEWQETLQPAKSNSKTKAKPKPKLIGKKQKYWFFHGRTNDKANGKKIAKWLIDNLTTEVIEKFVREWKRANKKAA